MRLKLKLLRQRRLRRWHREDLAILDIGAKWGAFAMVSSSILVK